MQVIRVSTVIRAKRSEVWEVFTDPQTWGDWYGGILEKVDPAWQKGARLIWQWGPPSRILEIVPPEYVVERSDSIKTTWKFTERGRRTIVELENDFRVGTMIVVDSAARTKQAEDEINGLKKYVEKRYKKWYQFWK